MNKTLLGIMICVCFSLYGMEPEEAEQTHLISEAMPAFFNYFCTFYNNIGLFDQDDQAYIQAWHDWYCKLISDSKCNECNPGAKISASDFNEAMEAIYYLNDKYNRFPSAQREINAIHATKSLSDYWSERITRLMCHRGQFGKHQSQSIDDFHTWFHNAFLAFHKEREAKGEEMAISRKTYSEIERGLDYLDDEANMPHIDKPQLHDYRVPRWYTFQALPLFTWSKKSK